MEWAAVRVTVAARQHTRQRSHRHQEGADTVEGDAGVDGSSV